jgi:hypothetical protein
VEETKNRVTESWRFDEEDEHLAHWGKDKDIAGRDARGEGEDGKFIGNGLTGTCHRCHMSISSQEHVVVIFLFLSSYMSCLFDTNRNVGYVWL